jgi:hypothetical protein
VKKDYRNSIYGFVSNPWMYFFAFLVANSLLSYLPFSLEVKLWIGLTGIILPFGLALTIHQPKNRFKNNFLEKDSLFIPRVWIWLLLGALAVFARFFRLTTLSAWPGYDDSLWGWMALRFLEKEGWHVFYADSNFPAAYAWGLGFFFKCWKPSLFTLWFFPALLSALTVGAGYWAARMFFSRALSFLIGFMLAFGFWPLYVGRISDQMVLLLLAECLFLGLLGLFMRARSNASRNIRALALGFAAGAGFYIFISWVMVAVLGIAAVLAFCLKQKPRRLAPLAFFSISFLLLFFPMIHAGLLNSLSSYGSSVGLWTQSFGGFGRQLSVSLSYVAVLFWGMDPSFFTYQPAWGGFLNPVLGSFFGLGLLVLLHQGGARAWWLMGSFVLLLLPGMLTNSREPLRVLPVLPVLFTLCAMGWQNLLKRLPSRKILPVLTLLALVVAGLDFYHLAVKYHRIWNSPETWSGYGKSLERSRALPILEKTAAARGPGLVFNQFPPGLSDQSLSVLSHPFNAVQNPALSPAEARWAGILTNVNYKPFLDRRFSHGKAYALSSGLNRPDGGWMLYVFPVTDQNRPVLEKWRETAWAFEGHPHQNARVLLSMLQKAYPVFHGDAFLESSYWEKVADLSFKISDFKDYEKSIQALDLAIKLGYPSSHLYQQMGFYYLLARNIPAAKKSFKNAGKTPLNLTQSRQWLQRLEKNGFSPPP